MRFSIFVAVAIVAFLPGSAPAEVRYTVTELQTLGGAWSGAEDINESGQVVGCSWEQGDNRACLWSGNTVTDLGTLGSVPGSAALAINDVGQSVGWSKIDNSSRSHAVLWANGTKTDLGSWSANDINNSGTIVGYSDSSHATVWSNGSTSDLGTLGGTSSMAQAINDKGEVTGFADNADGKRRAFYWKGDGRISDLGILPGYSDSYGWEINNAGIIVGESRTSFVQRACMWSGGTITDLGTLPGIVNTAAHDINSEGTVVGWAYSSDGPRKAFIWQNGHMRDLNDLIDPSSGFVLQVAHGINDSGWIVGFGTNALGQDRGFLLTPVPEPSSLLLFVLGALALLRKR